MNCNFRLNIKNTMKYHKIQKLVKKSWNKG